METTTPTPISMVSQISVIEWTVDTRERSAVLAHRSGMKLLPVMREPSMPARKADEHASVHDCSRGHACTGAQARVEWQKSQKH